MPGTSDQYQLWGPLTLSRWPLGNRLGLAEGQVPQETSNPNRNHVHSPGVWEDGWGVCAQARQLGYFKTLAKQLMGDRGPGGSKGSRSCIFQGQGLLMKGLV